MTGDRRIGRSVKKQVAQRGNRTVSHRHDVGLFTTCLVDGAGIVSCAGKNDNGELGTGDRERRYTLTDEPLAVPE